MSAGKSSVAEVGQIEGEAAYYQGADEWAEEKYRLASRRARLWQYVGLGSGVIALLLSLSLAGLTPMKTAVPYVIKVDSSSGIVEIIEPLREGTVPGDEALTKYFIVQYLQAREQYERQRFEVDANKVSMMSSGRVFDEYSQEFAPSVEDSPFRLYGDNGTVTIEVRSINFLDADTAVVRLKRSVNRQGERRESDWMITLSFSYLLTPGSESDRFVNPLGFQVTQYRKDPMVLD